MALNVVIVGAGFGGLAAALALHSKGHHVTVLEATPSLQTIGGIIFIHANGCRVLQDIGVYNRLLTICRAKPFTIGMRRYEDGSWLWRDAGVGYTERYGYPGWGVHRADYQRVLYDETIERGISVRLGCRVESIDEDDPSLILEGGEKVEADVIVGADGMRSVVRKSMYPEAESEALHDVGLDVTRVNIPEAIMKSNPETAELMDHIALWFGPHTLVANIPVRRGPDRIFGYDFVNPRDQYSSPYKPVPQNFEHMKGYFKDFPSTIQKLFTYVEEHNLDRLVWQMHETKPKQWVSKSGKVAILGDAAHAFTPWIGQGGTMAIEDAVTLAECLSYLQTKSTSSASSTNSTAELSGSAASSAEAPDTGDIDIADRLRLYESIRQHRAFTVQARSKFMGQMYTLPDGEMQQMRDEKLLQIPWDMNRNDIAPDMEKYSVKWVDKTPAFDAPPQEWDDWIIGFHAVGYAKQKVNERYGDAKAGK